MKHQPFLFTRISVGLFSAKAQTYFEKITPPFNRFMNSWPGIFATKDPSGNTRMGLGGKQITSIFYKVSRIGFIKISDAKKTNTTYNTSNSTIANNDVTSIGFCGSTVWIGCKSGLIHFNGSSFSVYNKNNSNLIKYTLLDLSSAGRKALNVCGFKLPWNSF